MKHKGHGMGFSWFIFFSLLYVALLAAISVLNRFGADRFWFGALNLYLPQAMWLLPGIVLTVVALFVARRWIWLPLLCLLWVIGPVMGLCLPLHPYTLAPGDLLLRVMTCNTKYGKYPSNALISDIDRYSPDLLLFQDAEEVRKSELGKILRSWHVRYHGQYVVASKLPLSEFEVFRIEVPGEKEDFLRVRLMVGGKPVSVYNVHLQTPRAGLNAFRKVKRRPWYFPKAVERFEGNVEVRLAQARALTERLEREKGAVILAGDLNSPDASLTCLMLRDAGLHDAFAEGGRGYGYSYGHKLLQHRLPWIRVSWMRIDHIMMSDDLRTLSCWTGNGESSEHRPVLADLVLRGDEGAERRGR
ncbi:endonuclease/exonuclease/phosphatase family protein [Geomonas sp. RF6]|uniref:endonuclease/exonuclease/phosphatase family protein n=1 Tax=Geomonas sp. RF6 TaxID=2897342 RepID=UPI001E2DA5F9|nr:endonuclease/exonuclease/phosphatase family protein [Geomonas sp. RF6]UFS69406.1 endonuclease/exonuclease/phosphatase family protein [Geomonas sp. RF6]